MNIGTRSVQSSTHYDAELHISQRLVSAKTRQFRWKKIGHPNATEQKKNWDPPPPVEESATWKKDSRDTSNVDKQPSRDAEVSHPFASAAGILCIYVANSMLKSDTLALFDLVVLGYCRKFWPLIRSIK